MQPTILTSIIGLTIFYTFMFNFYKYANGKWNVSNEKKEKYLLWLDSHGKGAKKAIITLSIMYGLGMTLQIISLLTE